LLYITMCPSRWMVITSKRAVQAATDWKVTA
jgi:hypothetical protein